MDNAINFNSIFNLFPCGRQWPFLKRLAQMPFCLHLVGIQKDELALMIRDKNKPISSSDVNSWLNAIAKKADMESFRHLFDYFAPRLKSFVMSQGTDPQLAEEVVQETMVKVWRKAHQFDLAKASASTWIFTIARNMRVDLLRKINRPVPDYNDPAFIHDPEPLAPEIMARNQDAEELNRLISTLPIEQQEVLNLAYFEHMAHAGIADQLNIPLGTVKSRIRLALKRIRVTLGDIR